MTLGEALSTKGADRSNNFLILRMAAAILVVWGHSFPLAAPCAKCSEFVGPLLGWHYSGDFAVLVFFVISGFLVSESYKRRDNIFHFVAARVLRLFPALIVFVLLTGLVMGLLLTSNEKAAYLAASGTWRYIWTNGTLQSPIFSLPGVFSHNRYGPAVDGTLWTLWIEGRFYLLVCLAGAFGFYRKNWLSLLLLAALGAWVVFYPASFPFVTMTLPAFSRLAFDFAIGVVLSSTKEKVPLRLDVAILVLFSAFILRGSPTYEVLFPLVTAYIVMYLAFLPKLPLPKWLGDYSYGCYLYGWPVQQIIAQQFPAMGPYRLAAIAIPVAVLCGAASWYIVEKPALAFKVGKRAPSPTSSSSEPVGEATAGGAPIAL